MQHYLPKLKMQNVSSRAQPSRVHVKSRMSRFGCSKHGTIGRDFVLISKGGCCTSSIGSYHCKAATKLAILLTIGVFP